MAVDAIYDRSLGEILSAAWTALGEAVADLAPIIEEIRFSGCLAELLIRDYELQPNPVC